MIFKRVNYLLISLLLTLCITSCKKKDPEPDPIVISDKNLTLGNPSGSTSDVNAANNYLLTKNQYTLSYNNSKGTANWVSWNINSSSLGSTTRQDDYRTDLSLPSQFYRVTETEFFGSGFDRGHLCPSGDWTNSVSNNSATFLMSNMIPQAPNNNRLTWQDLESYCRSLVSSGKELYVIAGPYGSGGSGSTGGTTFSLASGRIIVPQSVWKIIVVLSPGASNVDNVTPSTRVISVNMPNTQAVSNQSWDYYRTSIDQIESLTGYDFLSNVPLSIQAALESSIDSGPTN